MHRRMMGDTELSVWTRGIIMDKEGRDIVNSVGDAGRLEGKFAQAMENYGDNPDRTNAPTRKYCRLSDGVIENALTYENEHPNIVVLVEETMVKGWDYMRGMPQGGTLVMNTHYSPEYMIRFVPGPERLAQLVCVDAAKLAGRKWTPWPQKAQIPPKGSRFRLQASRLRLRRKKGRTFSPPATGVRSGRCTGTSCRPATTLAEPTKRFRAISTW